MPDPEVSSQRKKGSGAANDANRANLEERGI